MNRNRRLATMSARAGAIAACVALIAGCSSPDKSPSDSGSAGAVGSGTSSATKSVCGLGNGQEATGDPILLGGIYTMVPGIDFTAAAKTATAYFECVNANGGINGRPVEFKYYTEPLKSDQASALAQKIVEQDNAVGVVGNFDILDCAVNGEFYKEQNLAVIGVGTDSACFESPNFAPVNSGPRYSNTGAAQALVQAGATGTLVVTEPAAPNGDYSAGGACAVAEEAGLKCITDMETLPITDPNGVILKLVQQAGDGGGIIINHDPETAAALMQAAHAQNVVDKVFWGASTPLANTDSASIAGANGFDDKIYIDSEFALLSAETPDMQLYRDITEAYEPSLPIQSFGQMGFLTAKFATNALLGIDGPITRESFNQAVVELEAQETDMLCKPWYFGDLPGHLANNSNIIVTYREGQVVSEQSCFDIAAVDPVVEAARAAEAQGGQH